VGGADIGIPFLPRRYPATVGAYGSKIHFTRNSIHFSRTDNQSQRLENNLLISRKSAGTRLALW
jgi:hypothetical protein